MTIKGVIFDMDGVIIDTEKWYQVYWVKAANDLGYPMKPEHVLKIRSLPGKFAAPLLKETVCPDFDYCAVRDKRKEYMEKHVKKHGIEVKKGALELLVYLKKNNIKTSVATATDIGRTKKYLKEIDLLTYFDEIVCASMVKNGKPQPDIYLEAAKRLGLSPKSCIALEDSPNGVLSAYRAGCKTVMVPDLTPPDDDTKKLLFAQAESLLQVIDIIKNCGYKKQG